MRALWRALSGLYEHGALGHAKGAAYSALLALFPILTTVTTLLVQANAISVSRKVTDTLFQVAPPGVEEVIRAYFTTRGDRPVTLPVVATVLAVWAASGVMMSLMEGFQEAAGKPATRGVVKQRLIAMWLVVAGILPIVAASVMMLFGEWTEKAVLEWMGLLQANQGLIGGLLYVSKLIRLGVVMVTVYAVTSMFYYFGPSLPRKGRPIHPGALLATILWIAATTAFTWYVRNMAGYNVLYGSIGAVIALIVWMYILSLISIFGFEYNVALTKR